MVAEALEAAELLEKVGISAEVINIHIIKPLDKEAIVKTALKTKRVVTVEDHSTVGGLGSAVGECLCENIPTPLKRIVLVNLEPQRI